MFEQAIEMTNEKPIATDTGLRSGTILVVDDELVVRSLAKMYLEGAGFTIVTAIDGHEALEVFKEQKNEITAVLLDLTMPRMDGEECFREMKRIKSDIPVILSSGYDEQEATSRFAGKGLAGFLKKPYKVKKLLEKILDSLS
ncbi:MAG: response regulator [Deltaproteobacteria bacterium]|nr:response regulator [Deltaproteobacteria bacterium]